MAVDKDNLVIVAIPREDDPVWKISSEKVPHLTILFLGDADNPNRGKMAEFLEHAANTSLTRFGLDVDRRGELGDAGADVLFFQDNWELPKLRRFRAQLLLNDNIKKAYDSAEQFDGEWKPHLTLGYPESPAKSTSERIYWVQFDKLALWEGNYEGPEFLLKDYFDSRLPEEVLMSDTAAAGRQFLAHYGVKGMRWGQRKNTSPTEAAVKESLSRSGKTKLKGEGGKSQPAAEDAVKAALTKQKLKKSGPQALSNKELKDLSERMQLEVNTKRLVSEADSGPGKKYVKELVTQQGKRKIGMEAGRIVDEKTKR